MAGEVAAVRENPKEPASVPIVCTLSSGELATRRDGLLPGLVARASAREPVEGGLRWRFEPEDGLVGDIAAVIDAERRCCRFLSFVLRIEPDGGPVLLEVTGPEGTEGFLTSLVDGPA